MIQGQQNVSITEKELSNLARMTDEALKQKVLVNTWYALLPG